MKLLAKKKLKILKISLTIIASLWISTASAALVKSLYSAQIPVPDTTSQAQQKAMSTALKQVLVKVSGDSNIINMPALQPDISQAESLIQSYSYNEPTDDKDPLLLQVQFEPGAINQLLTKVQKRPWSKDRPLTLIWLAVTDNQGNTQQINDNSPEAQIIKQDAALRGLPIIFPILDLQDLNNISINDIQIANPPAIKTASSRYNANAILVGYIHATIDNNWQSNWTLMSGDTTLTWSIPGTDENQILTTVTDDVANALATTATARSPAVKTTATSSAAEVTIQIDDVTDMDQYAAIMKYLQNLASVKKAELLDTSPTNIIVKLTCAGTTTQLISALNLDKKIVPTDSDTTESNANLFYKLAKQ